MKICESGACTGCAACMNICPHNSIKMMLNAKGFSVPCVDEVSCIECGLCIEVCPSNHEIHVDGLIQQEVYAAKCRDIKLRMASSSGGIFTVIAEKILQGGVMSLHVDTLKILKRFSILFALWKKILELSAVQSTSRHPPIGYIQT